MGATPPANGDGAAAAAADPWRRGPRGDPALRRRMLGARAAAPGATGHVASRPRPREPAAPEGDAEDGDATGRTAEVGLGRGKRRRGALAEGGTVGEEDGEGRGDGAGEGGDGDAMGNARAEAGRGKRPGSYLDEVLEAKRRKKAKKKRKKADAAEGTAA